MKFCSFFCSSCCHGVVDMKRHLQSEDHKRSLRRLKGDFRSADGVRLPGQPSGVVELGSFPGRSTLTVGSYKG